MPAADSSPAQESPVAPSRERRRQLLKRILAALLICVAARELWKRPRDTQRKLSAELYFCERGTRVGHEYAGRVFTVPLWIPWLGGYSLGERTGYRVDLSQISLTDSDFQRLNELKNVTRISLRGTGATSEMALRLKSLRQLEFLDLSKSRVDGRVLALVGSLPKLRDFRIMGTEITDEDLDLLGDATTPCEVYLYGTRVTPSAAIQRMAQTKNVLIDLYNSDPDAP